MKTIQFENKKVLALLKENAELSNEINKIIEEWQKKDQYVKKLSMKMDRIKEKIRPIVAEAVKARVELGEFEIVGSTKLNKDLVEVEIFDEVELFKEQIRARKLEANKLPEDVKH